MSFLRSIAGIVRALISLRFMNQLFIVLLVGLRPLLGFAQCYYPQTCGNYAVEQLEQKPLLKALWAITKRLLSCNPFVKHSLQ